MEVQKQEEKRKLFLNYNNQVHIFLGPPVLSSVMVRVCMLIHVCREVNWIGNILFDLQFKLVISLSLL